jgi:hypothetical protein
LPWWGILVGVWLAAGYWPLTPEVRLLVSRTVFVLAAASVTLAAAAVASRMVDSYGAVIAPALPVSSLTRSVAWSLIAIIGLLVILDVGVDYASDLAHVERVVTEVGREVMAQVQGAVRDFDPFIRYHTFADSSINFTAILRGREFVDQYLIKHEFVKRLHARFDREGIVIPFPIRTIAHRGAGATAAQTESKAGKPNIRQLEPDM